MSLRPPGHDSLVARGAGAALAVSLVAAAALGGSPPRCMAQQLGEGMSSPFGVYVGRGFAPPAGVALASAASGLFNLHLGRGFAAAVEVGLGAANSAAFDLYLWRLFENSMMSLPFTLDTRSGTVSADGDDGVLPVRFELAAPRPNPFRGQIALGFAVPRPTKVSVAVYDVRGARVKQVVHELLSGGRYTRVWEGRDERGNPVPSGVYFVRLSGPGLQLWKRAVLIR